MSLRIKKVMINKIERTKEDVNGRVIKKLFSFVAAHSITKRVVPLDDLIKWVKYVRKYRKRARVNNESDVRHLLFTN